MKPTYEQALALGKGQAAARRASKMRAANAPGDVGDNERVSFMRKFSTASLRRRLASRHTPTADKQAMRAVLAERKCENGY